MLEDGQLALELVTVFLSSHPVSADSGDRKCQVSPSVVEFRRTQNTR